MPACINSLPTPRIMLFCRVAFLIVSAEGSRQLASRRSQSLVAYKCKGDLITLNPTNFRAAFADEIPRAMSLFTVAPGKHGEGSGLCFVAVKEHPVERIVGAAFWRMIPSSEGAASEVEFESALIPAFAGTRFGEEFLTALLAEICEIAPASRSVAPSAWLPLDHPYVGLLRSAGWEATASRRLFTANVAEWVSVLQAGGAIPLPEGMRIVSPAREHFEPLKALLCGEGRSLRFSELAHGFRSASSDSPSLFDARCSAVLMAGESVVAVCLVNLTHGLLTISALATRGERPEHADVLLRHCLCAHEGLGRVETLAFFLDDRDRLGPLEALADRMPVRTGERCHRFEAFLSNTKTTTELIQTTI